METELTKSVKRTLVGYRGKDSLKTSMRTVRYATEVWTPTGIVDFIRFEEILDTQRGGELYCRRIAEGEKCKSSDYDEKTVTFPWSGCKGCVYKARTPVVAKEYSILCTCYEIKISKSDFKSKNGHNFHGHENYYVVPGDLYASIVDLVPEEIGILCYYQETRSLRVRKPCKRKPCPDSILVVLEFNALKKWVDSCSEKYWS